MLSDEDIKSMLREKGLFHTYWNPAGSGTRHDYELQSGRSFWLKYFGQRKIIYDRDSGLIWQQSGSLYDIFYFRHAERYIEQLNRKRYGGQFGWRLPTLEEAVSLMEPEQRGVFYELSELEMGIGRQVWSNQYIDPLFDRLQYWIWTADWDGDGNRWTVFFHNGVIGHSPQDSANLDVDIYCPYVRAVCSG
jgi:serine/threonine-protein kinase